MAKKTDDELIELYARRLSEARRRLRALLNEQAREARRYKARMRRPR